MPLKQKSRKWKINIEDVSKILQGRVAMSVHIFYLGWQSSGHFDSCSLVGCWLQKEPRSKCWGAAAQYGCIGKIYTANIWNLYPKHVELQVKSFIKCHMILVESIRRKNPLVSNKAESYHGWIIVILPEEWERLCSCWAETWHEGWSGCYSSFCQSNIILQYLCRHSEEIRTI